MAPIKLKASVLIGILILPIKLKRWENEGNDHL